MVVRNRVRLKHINVIKSYQLVDRKKIPSIYRKQITHIQSVNETHMELWNRTVGLCQQVQHSHHAETLNQNSQSHTKFCCIPSKMADISTPVLTERLVD
jgi:hypothetical protein